MKTKRNLILTILGVLLVLTMSYAQNYKAPKIDASGKITDEHGMHIGTLQTDGTLLDTSGKKIAFIDATGHLVDSKTNKKLGKPDKNGNYAPLSIKTPDKGWSVTAPENGTCLVKDKDGNIKAEVHENYKQFGACAIHCLSHNMDHGKVMEHKTGHKEGHKHDVKAVTYVCPMHPDVTSDKPGSCNKCGMDLVKKE